MNLHLYWRSLEREHERSVIETESPSVADQKFSFVLFSLCAAVTLILLAAGGYRIGFQPVHDAGRHFSAAFLESLSQFGETLPAICLFALFAKRRPGVLWMGLLAGIYATTLTYALKHLFSASRPPAVLGNWVAISGDVLKLHSFPSGHTVTAFLLATCFSAGAPRISRFALYSFAAAVGCSRVWLGVHWPIDVIAGAGVAAIAVCLAIQTSRISQWGLRLVPHLSFISLIGVCAILELMPMREYPLPRLLRAAIAAASLSVLIRDYVFAPLAARQSYRGPISI